jgi:gamma-glutamyltranspeptidase / glutathione hydrolase
VRSLLPAGIFTLVCASLSNGVDLSPEKWPAEDRALVEALEQQPWPPATRLVEGNSGVVAATMSPIAVRAGIEALRQGGTAADAAATVALTQVATALGSYVSYGGVAQLVYYHAKTRRVYSMNAGWASYLEESEPMTIPEANSADAGQGRKTLVPGFMAGIEAMQERFGVLAFADVFQPAIWYSVNGVTVSPLLASYFASRRAYLSRTPEGRAFLGQAGSSLPAAGERFVQADAATTLRAIALQGSHFMYAGAWGREYVAAVQRKGGKATIDDMRRYQPTWEEPLSTTFNGHTLYGPGQSTQGGYDVLEAMNLIEALKIDQMDPYWKDPKAFQGLSRVLELAVITPYIHGYIASSALESGVTLSPQDRATKAYAHAMLAVIDPIFNAAQEPPGSDHSDAIVVIDRWGNVAALAHSINTVLWGTTGMVIGGVPLADAACFQQARLAALAPGDRVPNEMAPIIVLTDGTPTVAVAAVGAALLPETVRILLGAIGNHAEELATMDAPPLLMNSHYAQRGMIQVPEGRYDPAFLASLGAAGLTVQTRPSREVWGLRGTAVLGTISAPSGARQSVEVSGIFGFAEGY